MSEPAVLFVCLGNICRSPLAEAAFREAARQAGLDCLIDSVGTAAYHVGERPDPRSVATAKANGVDISNYRGRQLEPEDYTRFTHIYAMDADNLANIEARRPDNSTAQVALLLDLVPGREGEDVIDPYYGGDEGFARTWDDVNRAAKALVARLTD